MNDLDRDLRELFHDKAGSIDAAPAAPTEVLRRGRRRQVRTVFASSLAAVAALAIAVAVAARLTGGPNQIPVTNPSYGERIATIHGITVTAPAGWTLIDDWPVASLLPTTSQTCSFSATGSPIGPSPAGGSSTSSEPVVEPSSSCTSEPMPLPAGIPVLQLANFELPLDGTVCQVGDLRSVDLPADGVAAYVAAFPQGMTTEDFLAACPGGATVTTFAARGPTTAYAAVSLIGPDASPGDVAAVERFMNSLGGLRVPNDEPATASPGYVVAAGVDGGTTVAARGRFPVPRLRVGDRRDLGRDRRRRTRDGLIADPARRTERRANRTDRAPRRRLWMARVGHLVATRERDHQRGARRHPDPSDARAMARWHAVARRDR